MINNWIIYDENDSRFSPRLNSNIIVLTTSGNEKSCYYKGPGMLINLDDFKDRVKPVYWRANYGYKS